MGNIVDKAKQAVEGFKKVLKRIGNFVKFIGTQIGFVIACLVLVVILIIILYIMFRSLGHAFNLLFNPDYAGISTAEDYKYISSTVSNANYDSLVSDKNYQEYLAYEYAVLMDVAEFIYNGQNELDFSKGEDAGHYKKVKGLYTSSGDEEIGGYTAIDGKERKEEVKSPDYMPYLKVNADYDLSLITHKQWQANVIAGQGSERYGFLSLEDFINVDNSNANELRSSAHEEYGGNRNVITPVLTYEFHNNQYDEDKGSLVPYITVVKEEKEYDYYTVGGKDEGSQPYSSSTASPNLSAKTISNGGRDKYKPGGKYAATKNSPGGSDAVTITEENIEDVNYMTINKDLNLHNNYLGTSVGSETSPRGPGYKSNDELKGASIDNVYNWPSSDTTFSQDLYYTGDSERVVYKIPLQSLIDRYLPKAALITMWHLSKDNDYADREKTTGTPGEAESKKLASEMGIFDVTELIGDIKSIYNTYCLTGKLNNNGKEIPKSDVRSSESVDAFVYDEHGNVIRMPDGTAQISPKSEQHNISTSGEITFLRFGQAGIESNKYGILKYYDPDASITGPRGDTEITHAVDEATVPTITDLISRSGEFIDTIDFDIVYYVPVYDEKGKYLYDNPVPIHATYYKSDIDTNNAGLVARDESIQKRFEESNQNMSQWNNRQLLDLVNGRNNGTMLNNFANANFSSVVFSNGIVPAEADYVSDPDVLSAMTENVGNPKKELVNYTYIYASKNELMDTEELKTRRLLLDEIAEYDQNVAYYDFAFFKSHDIPIGYLNKHIEEECQKEDHKRAILIAAGVPSAYLGNAKINSITPHYQRIFDYANTDEDNPSPHSSIFKITEETIALTIDIKHRRSPIMMVTEAYTWAKDIKYDIKIYQNSFNPDNYKYVIPHSRFAYGLTNLQVTEKSKYRASLYEKYFSNPNEQTGKPALKESDILSMFLNWEDMAGKGLDTANVYIRDLYKLVMILRDNGKLLESAYNYMYVPEHIWNFNDGITQAAYWTNILGSGVGNEDTLSYDELRKLQVTKNILSWQQVNYDKYEECVNGNTASVYALFPLGSPFARSYYMEVALKGDKDTNSIHKPGYFDSGSYTSGHRGSDWFGRKKIVNILQAGEKLKYGEQSTEQTIEAEIYNYEIKRRTLQKIMELGYKQEEKLKAVNSFLSGADNGNARGAYAMAKGELDAELGKQSINSPIVAAAAGIVQKAGFNCYSGFTVTICHDADATSDPKTGKVKTVYCHFRRWPEVNVGDMVGPGTVIGYEGTTGESGGLHIHVNVTTGKTGDDKWESPSAYYGPIFTPFYNEDKANEVLESYSSNEILALSSEYFSLIRTVFLARFAKNGSLVTSLAPNMDIIPTAVFTTLSGDTEHEYVQFPDADALFSGDKLVLKSVYKENTLDKYKYYQCEVEELDKVLKEMQEKKTEKEFKELRKEINERLLSGRNLYRIQSSGEIQLKTAAQIERGNIHITTQPGGGGTWTKIQWGNNVPLYPLFEDMKDAFDLNLLKAQKLFTLSANDSDGANEVSQNEDDIYAWSVFFNEDAPETKARLNNSMEMFPYFADIDSPFAVPIYDGPVSMEMYEQLVANPDTYGLIGTNSGDLKKLQVAMRAKGFDKGHQMNIDGIYDEATAEVIKRASQAMIDAGFDGSVDFGVGAGMQGNLGAIKSLTFEPTSMKNDSRNYYKREFGTTVVTTWNAFVTYGTKDKAVYASKCALSNAALQSGIHYTFLLGIAINESSLISTSESERPLYFAPFTGVYNGSLDTNSDLNVFGLDDAVIKYRGEMKTVRRAQGLMQCIWSSALGKGPAHGVTEPEPILDAIRMPNTSAIYAADSLKSMILTFKRNKAQYSVIRSIAKEAAWKAAAKDADVTSETLVLYALCCFRYHGDTLFGENGNFNTSIIDKVRSATYKDGVIHADGSPNYWQRVINLMIQNTPKH